MPSYVIFPRGVVINAFPGINSAKRNKQPSNPRRNPKCLKIYLLGLRSNIRIPNSGRKYTNSVRVCLVAMSIAYTKRKIRYKLNTFYYFCNSIGCSKHEYYSKGAHY